MEAKQVNRREFLQSAAVIGTVALTAGSAFKAMSAEPAAPGKLSVFVCQVCGHLEFGSAPEACPICHAPREKFMQNDMVFSDAQSKFSDVTDKHTPEVSAKKKSTMVTEAPSIAVEAKIG
jgi:hypothetical protein